jgi:predicted dehydrogenase
MVVFDYLDTEARIRVHNKGVAEPDDVGDLTQPPMSYRYGEVVAPYLVVNEPLSIEDEHFADCALTGMRPLTDGANGLAVVAALEAAERSFRERREVGIDEVWTNRVDVHVPVQRAPDDRVPSPVATGEAM